AAESFTSLAVSSTAPTLPLTTARGFEVPIFAPLGTPHPRRPPPRVHVVDPGPHTAGSMLKRGPASEATPRLALAPACAVTRESATTSRAPKTTRTPPPTARGSSPS